MRKLNTKKPEVPRRLSVCRVPLRGQAPAGVSPSLSMLSGYILGLSRRTGIFCDLHIEKDAEIGRSGSLLRCAKHYKGSTIPGGDVYSPDPLPTSFPSRHI